MYAEATTVVCKTSVISVTNVYVSFPAARAWEIHRTGAEPVVLRGSDRFELPDVLPGFSVAVDELWPE